MKPLGGKSYGSIPHLPDSRMGPADHHCHKGQAEICLVKPRDKHDIIYVQEKLDGSNVGVAKIDGKILALTRSGYLANTSPYIQHHLFHHWVERNAARFDALLREGERACGEWLIEAHGTKYKLWHEPFVLFDLIAGKRRSLLFDTYGRASFHGFKTPSIMPPIGSCGVSEAMAYFGKFGRHGATEQIEGVMYRVERKGEVDFLAKFVRHDKEDGKYLREENRVWNELRPEDQYLLTDILPSIATMSVSREQQGASA